MIQLFKTAEKWPLNVFEKGVALYCHERVFIPQFEEFNVFLRVTGSVSLSLFSNQSTLYIKIQTRWPLLYGD